MKKFLKPVLISLALFASAPAYAGQAVHMFTCNVDDDVTEEQIEASASAWLAAAKTMKGGENLKASMHQPVAAKMDTGDMVFVIVAPSLAEWGMFWDGYKGSAADKLDKANSDIACPNSALFESMEVK